MAYLFISDFSAGLDTRKHVLASPPGTLTRLVNAAITPGGEIMKRRAFGKVATLTGTFGLAAIGGVLYAFTRNVDITPPPSGVPDIGLVYQKIPSSSTTLKQTDFDVFDNKIYLAGYDSGVGGGTAANPHFYDGAAVPDGNGKGFYIRAYQSKMYAVADRFLYFSAVGDPTLWTTGTGSGNINVTMQDADAANLLSLEVYYDKLALFSSEASQLWATDPDPLKNQLAQVLRGSGTIAPFSALQYGSGDVLYMTLSGIRSLRARDSSNSAAVSDIGSPIDGIIQDIRFNPSLGLDYLKKAIAVLEPVIGRFWMVFPTQIMVLSYFPGPKITAWSVYTLPFSVDYAVTSGGRVFLRSGDDLYVYGGASGEVFENCGVEVRLPYLDAKKPGHNKGFEAFDITCFGTWRVAVSYDFNQPDVEETIGTFNKPTWNAGRAELAGMGSHFSLRFYNEDDQPAQLSNAAVHLQMQDDEA